MIIIIAADSYIKARGICNKAEEDSVVESTDAEDHSQRRRRANIVKNQGTGGLKLMKKKKTPSRVTKTSIPEPPLSQLSDSDSDTEKPCNYFTFPSSSYFMLNEDIISAGNKDNSGNS